MTTNLGNSPKQQGRASSSLNLSERIENVSQNVLSNKEQIRQILVSQGIEISENPTFQELIKNISNLNSIVLVICCNFIEFDIQTSIDIVKDTFNFDYCKILILKEKKDFTLTVNLSENLLLDNPNKFQNLNFDLHINSNFSYIKANFFPQERKNLPIKQLFSLNRCEFNSGGTVSFCKENKSLYFFSYNGVILPVDQRVWEFYKLNNLSNTATLLESFPFSSYDVISSRYYKENKLYVAYYKNKTVILKIFNLSTSTYSEITTVESTSWLDFNSGFNSLKYDKMYFSFQENNTLNTKTNTFSSIPNWKGNISGYGNSNTNCFEDNDEFILYNYNNNKIYDFEKYDKNLNVVSIIKEFPDQTEIINYGAHRNAIIPLGHNTLLVCNYVYNSPNSSTSGSSTITSSYILGKLLKMEENDFIFANNPLISCWFGWDSSSASRLSFIDFEEDFFWYFYSYYSNTMVSKFPKKIYLNN